MNQPICCLVESQLLEFKLEDCRLYLVTTKAPGVGFQGCSLLNVESGSHGTIDIKSRGCWRYKASKRMGPFGYPSHHGFISRVRLWLGVVFEMQLANIISDDLLPAILGHVVHCSSKYACHSTADTTSIDTCFAHHHSSE